MPKWEFFFKHFILPNPHVFLYIILFHSLWIFSTKALYNFKYKKCIFFYLMLFSKLNNCKIILSIDLTKNNIWEIHYSLLWIYTLYRRSGIYETCLAGFKITLETISYKTCRKIFLKLQISLSHVLFHCPEDKDKIP